MISNVSPSNYIIEKISHIAVTIGMLLLVTSLVWWTIYYAKAIEATKPYDGSLLSVVECLGFGTTKCGSLETGNEIVGPFTFFSGEAEGEEAVTWLEYGLELSRPDGIIPYHSSLFWLSIFLLLSGLLTIILHKDLKLSNLSNSHLFTAYLLILPSLVGFIVFFLLPSINALQISFYNWNLLQPPKFVGLENYQDLFADKRFLRAMRLTFYYVLLTVPLQMILGVALANFLDTTRNRLASWLRNIMVLPWLLPPVVAATIWLVMLPTVINTFLELVGIGKQPFFASPNQVLATIASISVWQYTGYSAILFLAGLQSIPKELYQAAAIDGTNAWQRFWHITVPLLRPTTAFVLITSLVTSVQVFDTVAIVTGTGPTGGGPVGASRVIMFYIFNKIYNQAFKMGMATAASIILLIILITAAFLQLRLGKANRSDLADLTEQSFPTLDMVGSLTSIGWQRLFKQFFKFMAVALCSILILFPMYWMFRYAFTHPGDSFYAQSYLIPARISFLNFARILGSVNESGVFQLGSEYLGYMRNSIIITSVTTTCSVFFSATAAYAFARLNFVFRDALFTLYLTALMVPAIVLLIPNLVLVKQLGWIGTFAGIMAPSLLMTPFAVFFLRQAFLSLNQSIEEAATLDGASKLRYFTHFALPLVQGSVFTVATLTFLMNWNQYLWPFFVGRKEEVRMITVALGMMRFDRTGVMVVAMISIIPAMLLFFLLGSKMGETVADKTGVG